MAEPANPKPAPRRSDLVLSVALPLAVIGLGVALSSGAASAFLALRGLNCPLPVLRTKKALAALAPGTRVVVEATDPMSAIDIPHFCGEAGHRLVERQAAGGLYRFTIERG